MLRAARANYVAGLTLAQHERLRADLISILYANLPVGGVGQPPCIVAGYAPRGSEIDPGPCDLFPYVGGNNGLTFHRCTRVELVPGYADIAEPPADALAVDPDVILVPLIAVDARGTRLGQGAGHYDRTLAALRARRPVLAVGIAWDMQQVEDLRADPWDEHLDALATPSRWLTFARIIHRRD